MSDGSERLGGFVRDLGEAARSNPISAALIGMGALWLFAGRSQRATDLMRRSGIDRLPDTAQKVWEGAGSSVRDFAETAGEATDTIRRQGDRAAQRVAEAGERLVNSVSDFAGDLPDRASNLLDDTKGSLAELFKSQPLAIGAVGIAIGAAIASAFPTTETEAEYLGGSSEFVKQKASELAGEQIERATEIGENVAAAAAEEARRQGLTPDGLKSAVDELSAKAARVAEAAKR